MTIVPTGHDIVGLLLQPSIDPASTETSRRKEIGYNESRTAYKDHIRLRRVATALPYARDTSRRQTPAVVRHHSLSQRASWPEALYRPTDGKHIHAAAEYHAISQGLNRHPCRRQILSPDGLPDHQMSLDDGRCRSIRRDYDQCRRQSTDADPRSSTDPSIL